MSNADHLNKLICTALDIEALEAKEAGALGFTARSLIQATMPHSKPKDLIFHRENGNFTLTMFGNPKVGLPYGSLPRLLMAWLTTEALRLRTRKIPLGHSLSDFMRELGLVPTGGRWGSITRLKDQARRLFSCNVSYAFNADENGSTVDAGANLSIADNYVLWWSPQDPNQEILFESEVELSEKFFNEIVNRPVPLDMRALKALSRSPMALDIYSWLTYRMSYLKAPTIISWDALKLQFGAEYKELKTFKFKFLKQLKNVLLAYPQANAHDGGTGLVLRPSQTHINMVPKPKDLPTD